MKHDQIIYPTPTHNHHGQPRWEGSEAQCLLKLNVSQAKHISLQPKELFETQKEYYENFLLTVF
jgi:hypothetical protein